MSEVTKSDGQDMSTLSLKKHGTGIVLEYGKVKLALDTGVQGATTLLSHYTQTILTGLTERTKSLEPKEPLTPVLREEENYLLTES